MSFYKTGINSPGPKKLPFSDLSTPSIEVFRAIEKARGRVGQLYQMGFYRLGVNEKSALVGQFIATPGYIKDEVGRLHRDASAVGRGVVNHWERLKCTPTMREGECGKLNDFMTSTLGPFMNNMNKFFENHKYWYQNLSSSTLDTVDKRRKTLVKIHKAAEKLGVGFVGPAPPGPEPGTLEKIGQSLKGLIIAVFLLGGGYVAFKTWQERGASGSS